MFVHQLHGMCAMHMSLIRGRYGLIIQIASSSPVSELVRLILRLNLWLGVSHVREG